VVDVVIGGACVVVVAVVVVVRVTVAVVVVKIVLIAVVTTVVTVVLAVAARVLPPVRAAEKNRFRLKIRNWPRLLPAWACFFGDLKGRR
jgi:hypothetical protein